MNTGGRCGEGEGSMTKYTTELERDHCFATLCIETEKDCSTIH